MTPEVFAKALFILFAAYEKKLDQDTVEVYYQFLNHLTPEQLERAAKRHITRSPYFPKVSELLQAVREDLASATDVWTRLLKAAEDGEKPLMDAATERALDFIGGWEQFQITSYDDLRFRFRDFEKVYLEGQTRELERISGRQEPVAALER